MRKTLTEWMWFILLNILFIGAMIAAQTELTL
jgi:hypothetical protein